MKRFNKLSPLKTPDFSVLALINRTQSCKLQGVTCGLQLHKKVKSGFLEASKLIAVLALALVCAKPVFAAPIYKDVPESHPAYAAISRVADRGYIVGDISGNFNPDAYIDKFETSKILSRVSGYKYTGQTAAEQQFYDNAYERNKSYIDQYKRAFAKWNPVTDKEVAFLLEKGILLPEDLNQFVIKSQDGEEKLRALSRSEACVFLVRLAGKTNEALAHTPPSLFNDDATISEASKPYVYYLLSTGVVTKNELGNFTPNGAVTKATMSVMLDRILKLSDAVPTPTPTPVATPTPTPVTSTLKFDNVSGKIDKLLQASNACQIMLSDGTKKIYLATEISSIYVNSAKASFLDLKEGMDVTLTVQNDKDIIEMRATALGVNFPQPTPTPTPAPEVVPPQSSYQATQTPTYGQSMYQPPTQNNGASKLQGQTNFTNLVLTNRKTVNGVGMLFTKNADGVEYQYTVGPNSIFERKDYGKVTWEDIRIGDTLNISANDGVIASLQAYGSKTVIDGSVEEIHITRTGAYIVFKDTANDVKAYPLVYNTTDVYSIKVGSRIRLRLDSYEVETLTVLEEPVATFYTGVIGSLSERRIVLSDGKEVFYNSDTVFMDSMTGTTVPPTTLAQGMRIYVVYEDASSTSAKTITILSK